MTAPLCIIREWRFMPASICWATKGESRGCSACSRRKS